MPRTSVMHAGYYVAGSLRQFHGDGLTRCPSRGYARHARGVPRAAAPTNRCCFSNELAGIILHDAKSTTPVAAAREWATILASYRNPSHARSLFELLVTAGAFALFWLLAWAVLGLGYWLSL